MTNTNIWMNLPKVQSEETEKISSPTEVKQDCFPLKIIKTQNIILSEQKNGNKSFKLFNIIHPKTKEIEAAKPNFDQPSETFLQVKVPRAKGRIKNKKESGFTIDPKTPYIHSKYNQDNIKRKIKTHFHNFIIAFLNREIKKEWGGKQKFKFRKMESTITQDITIHENKKMLDEPLKNILSKVSKKFKDRQTNSNFVRKISKCKDNLKNIFNTKYKDIYSNYYLKSSHETFTGEKDESFEEHLRKIKEKDGIKYMQLFKENALKFVDFFLKGKERKNKKKKVEANEQSQANINNEELSSDSDSESSEIECKSDKTSYTTHNNKEKNDDVKNNNDNNNINKNNECSENIKITEKNDKNALNTQININNFHLGNVNQYWVNKNFVSSFLMMDPFVNNISNLRLQFQPFFNFPYYNYYFYSHLNNQG